MMTVNGLKTLDIKEIDRRSIKDIEIEIHKIKSFNFLYELNTNELKFKH